VVDGEPEYSVVREEESDEESLPLGDEESE
jgi:hypothetical protein